MDLLIDADAIPLSYGLFPGNESEKKQHTSDHQKTKEKICESVI